MEIAVIGAGSHFTLALLRSLYQQWAMGATYHLRFMDVRAQPLEALADLVPRLNALTDRSLSFSCHHERASALDGANHVLVAAAIDFPASFLRTCWVMRNHGIQFVEGETATPGALMATLRHLPLLVTIAREMKRHTDGAWLHIINNPMPRLVLGVMRGAGYLRVVGHCHGTLGVRSRIGDLTGTPSEDIDLFVAGINHFHLVQRAVDRRDGTDLLAKLRHLPADRLERWREDDFTQCQMFDELGYLVGHGIWHNFDYLPYANPRLFRHRDDNTWERACLVAQAESRAAGAVGSGPRSDDALRAFLDTPEDEQLFRVMQALSGETPPFAFLSGNMPNTGHIPNLPDGTIVELPATVTTDGVALHRAPQPFPLFFETWVRLQLAIHELSVRAALDGSRQAAIEAIACDPAFRDADCRPGQLLDEMLAANQGLVPTLG
jgi:alpha-galactosidase